MELTNAMSAPVKTRQRDTAGGSLLGVWGEGVPPRVDLGAPPPPPRCICASSFIDCIVKPKHEVNLRSPPVFT